MLNTKTVHDRSAWNALLRGLPCAHILQSWEWGDFKQRETGWTPERIEFPDAAASILTRQVGPLRVIYVPKGPVMSYDDPARVNAVLGHLEQYAKKHRAIWLKIDPDVIAGTGIPGGADPDHFPQDEATGQRLITILRERGWRFSASQVQFRNTVTLDLTKSEDDLLAGMNQGTRRKIRTAIKEGVTVRPANSPADLKTLYDLYTITGQRQGFLIRPVDYYREAWANFMDAGLAQAFLAEWNGRALAGLVLFHFGPKAWYFYGMSSNEERDRMPTYLIQWEAIRWAKAHGYTTYDFWGAPDEFTEDDPMWGVFRFKDGFGGTVVRHIGAYDYVPYPPLYWAYERLMPKILGIMRRRR